VVGSVVALVGGMGWGVGVAGAQVSLPLLNPQTDLRAILMPAWATPLNAARPGPLQRGVGFDGVALTGVHGAFALMPDTADGVSLAGLRYWRGVDLATGGISFAETHLSLPAHVQVNVGVAYGEPADANGNLMALAAGIHGPGWFQTGRPEIVFVSGAGGAGTTADAIVLITGPDSQVEFRRVANGSGTYVGANGAAGVMVVTGAAGGQPGLVTLTDLTGTMSTFFGFDVPSAIADGSGGTVALSAGARARLAGQLWKVQNEAGHNAYTGSNNDAASAIRLGFRTLGEAIDGLPRKSTDSAGRMYEWTYGSFGSPGVMRLTAVDVLDGGAGGGWLTGV